MNFPLLKYINEYGVCYYGSYSLGINDITINGKIDIPKDLIVKNLNGFSYNLNVKVKFVSLTTGTEFVESSRSFVKSGKVLQDDKIIDFTVPLSFSQSLISGSRYQIQIAFNTSVTSKELICYNEESVEEDFIFSPIINYTSYEKTIRAKGNLYHEDGTNYETDILAHCTLKCITDFYYFLEGYPTTKLIYYFEYRWDNNNESIIDGLTPTGRKCKDFIIDKTTRAAFAYKTIEQSIADELNVDDYKQLQDEQGATDESSDSGVWILPSEATTLTSSLKDELNLTEYGFIGNSIIIAAIKNKCLKKVSFKCYQPLNTEVMEWSIYDLTLYVEPVYFYDFLQLEVSYSKPQGPFRYETGPVSWFLMFDIYPVDYNYSSIENLKRTNVAGYTTLKIYSSKNGINKNALIDSRIRLMNETNDISISSIELKEYIIYEIIYEFFYQGRKVKILPAEQETFSMPISNYGVSPYRIRQGNQTIIMNYENTSLLWGEGEGFIEENSMQLGIQISDNTAKEDVYFYSENFDATIGEKIILTINIPEERSKHDLNFVQVFSKTEGIGEISMFRFSNTEVAAGNILIEFVIDSIFPQTIGPNGVIFQYFKISNIPVYNNWIAGTTYKYFSQTNHFGLCTINKKGE